MSSDNLTFGNSEALTSDCMLALKPSAPKSRAFRVNLSPSNKSVFTPLDTIYIDIPTRPGCWLDQSQSYLKFSVQVTSTAAAPVGGAGIYFDNSAYSLISRVDIFNSSNLLESIGEYGQLANALIDTSLTASDKAGLSTLIGTNAQSTYVTNAAAYANGSSVVGIQQAGDRSGMSLASVTPGTGIGAAIPYTFCLPMLGGILGAGGKMIPLKDLSAPINIQIYLSSIDDSFYYGTAAAGLNYQIVNVEYIAQFVEINDDRFNFSSPGVPQYISATTYRNASSFLPSATSGEVSTLVSIRAASLTQLLARFRNCASSVQGVNATACYRKSSSINPNLSSYYWRIGSQIVPSKPVYLNSGSTVSGGSESFAELLKSFHSLSSSIGNTSITNSNYNVAYTAGGAFVAAFGPGAKTTLTVPDTYGNAFMIGTELQTFSNRNDVIMSGISTLNTPVYLTMATVSGSTIGSNITLDVWGAMDMVLVIQDGIMSARF